MIFLVLFQILLSGSAVSIIDQHDSENKCELAKDDLQSNQLLRTASEKMRLAFEETCEATSRCLIDVGNETALTHLRYKAMRESDAYLNVRRACHDIGTSEEPTTLCKLDSILEVPDGEKNVVFVSNREPVCYHYNCGNNQIDLVDPSPLGCNPKTHDCVIHSILADCPRRPDGAGLGNCKISQKMVSEDEAYRAAKDQLNMELGSYCRGERDNLIDDPVCTYEVKPIPIAVAENYRRFETDPAYKLYSSACNDAGAQTCFVSLNSRILGKILLFNLDVTGDYSDYPICLPSTCDDETKLALAKESVAQSLVTRISGALNRFFRRRGLGEVLRGDDGNFYPSKGQENDKSNKDGEPCPLGMEECSVVVTDFYCTESNKKTLNLGNDDPQPVEWEKPLTSAFLTIATIIFLCVSVCWSNMNKSDETNSSKPNIGQKIIL